LGGKGIAAQFVLWWLFGKWEKIISFPTLPNNLCLFNRLLFVDSK
jgi:hypothetical protein